MYNKCFEYLKDNNPNKVISKFGVKFRKKVNWIFRRIMVPLSSHNKLKVEWRPYIPENKQVIYAATHGFRDDIAYSLTATGRHCYLLLGALNILFESIYGVALWFNGLVLVDREDKDSRSAAITKMCRVLEMGTNLMVFPEATWNKSENLLVLDLFPGIYDVAKLTGVEIVPVASIEEDGIVHVTFGEPFDITRFSREEGIGVLRDKMATAKYNLMEKYSCTKRVCFGDISEYWSKYLVYLESATNGLYDRIAESKAAYINKKKQIQNEVMNHLQRVVPSVKNAFLFHR